MTALTRVALACGAALIMATAALGALHTEREPAAAVPAPARPALSEPESVPSASEFELGAMPDGVWATR